MKAFAILFFSFFSLICAMAQISHGGIPIGLSPLNLKSIKSSVEVMPDIRDKLRFEGVSLDSIHTKTLKFAYSFDVDLNPINSGTWTTLNDGSRMWRLLISSENAKSINIIFSKFIIPEGAKVFVYAPDMSQVLGSFTHQNVKSSGILPVMPIIGDALVVEYLEPADVAFNGELEINRVNHDYLGFYDYMQWTSSGNFGSSQFCEIDATCIGGWEEESKSVVKMIIDGSELCSGTLINNVREDGTPYILSAAHCFADHNYDASGTIFIFNYEVPRCLTQIEGSREQSVAGGYLRAYSELEEFKNTDYALLEMSVRPPAAFRPYYCGWDASVEVDSNVVAIHHPNGDVKKLSCDSDEVVIYSLSVSGFAYRPNSHWWIKEWEFGATEGGSSGCALFNKSHRIIGSLSAGQASCNNKINDFFYCLNKVWTSHSEESSRLKHWLDPDNTETLVLDGYYPEEYKEMQRLSNLKKGEDIVVEKMGADGYQSGFNGVGVTQFAEHFVLEDTCRLYGFYFVPNKGSVTSTNSIRFKVWQGGVQPGNELWNEQVQIEEWERTQMVADNFGQTGGYTTKAYYYNKENFVNIDEELYPGDDFFVGYEIVLGGPIDTFALYQAQNRIAGENTAWFYKNEVWKPYTQYEPKPVFSSLYIDAVVNVYKNSSDTTIPTISNKIVRYIEPSPSIGDFFTLHFSKPLEEKAHISIYSLNGIKVSENYVAVGSNSYDTSFRERSGGVYIIRVTYQRKTEVYRIVNMSFN